MYWSAKRSGWRESMREIYVWKSRRISSGISSQSALTPLRALLDGRDVRVELPPEPLQVVVDAELIALTIRQLVGNALKYSNPESPVAVRARKAAGFIWIGVADSGPGIPESERERIFEKFYRAADSSAVPGSGMGL